jgi:hypothetical protein
MTMIYAVFLCVNLGGREICQPTSFRDDPTLAACEVHKRYMEGLANPGVKVACMRKQIPTWTPTR